MFEQKTVTISRRDFDSDAEYATELEKIITMLSEQTTSMAGIIDEIFEMVDDVADSYQEAVEKGESNKYADMFMSVFFEYESELFFPAPDEIH